MMFFKELPDFIYDRDELFSFQDKNLNYKENALFLKGHSLDTATECLFFDLRIDNAACVQKVIDDNKLDIKTVHCKFTKVLAGGRMPYHIDPYRSQVLMIPLTDDPAPVVWVDDQNKIIQKHIYRMPTIINAKIKHGVPRVEFDRIFLQMKYN